MLTIQYLEESAELAHLDVKLVVDRLRAAAERLPLTHLLIGWHVPTPLLEACRIEADHLGMRFLLWQPLLTGSQVFHPDSTWLTEGLTGHKLQGYRNLPEFTFMCPNHPAVQETVLKHVDDLIHLGLYQGMFLDRVRFPSPAQDPINSLACFCEHCQRKAKGSGLDLEQARMEIIQQTQDETGWKFMIERLLSTRTGSVHESQYPEIVQFMTFRKQSVYDFLTMVSRQLIDAGLEVGLDCFSPCLTSMVGQDLKAMSALVDWIKIMTYTHTLAPAGIPFELSGLLQYLSTTARLNEKTALDWLAQSSGLPLPVNRVLLERHGLSALGLEQEVRCGVTACTVPVLAGIELVDLEGVTSINREQLLADLAAVKRARPAGLAISWDLLHIPLERLELINQVYLGN